MMLKKKIFIMIFILSLTAPTLLFLAFRDRVDNTNYENRALAERPSLTLSTITEFPAQFEAWYNDHAPFKNYFVQAKNAMDTQIFGLTSLDAVTIGKDDWLFYTVSKKGEDAMADYQHTNLYTADEKADIARRLEYVEDEMAARGIDFALFIAPSKETIYGRYMPDNIRVYGQESRLSNLVKDLDLLYGVTIYDTTDALLAEADDYQLFYKYDTHWNILGAFMASRVITDHFLGWSVPVEGINVKYEEEVTGDLATMIGRPDLDDDPEYFIDDYMTDVTARCVFSDDDNAFEIYESDSPNQKTLLVVGDSFANALRPCLSKMYARCIFSTLECYEPELLDEYDVDDFAFVLVERNQKYLEHIDELVDGTYIEEDDG